MPQHLIKLSVGTESIDHLHLWQERRAFDGPDGERLIAHVTRNRPKREEAVLDGGCLYWIVKGKIVARNEIVGFEEVESDDGKKRCAIVMKVPAIDTVPKQHKIFQGWRYLDAANAPDDMPLGKGGFSEMPAEMIMDLKDLGLL